MVEGAVAHWQATGSRKFLDIAIRYANCVVREVGPNPGQACVVPGHQIAEMALCKIYLATGYSILRAISLCWSRTRLWVMPYVLPICMLVWQM